MDWSSGSAEWGLPTACCIHTSGVRSHLDVIRIDVELVEDLLPPQIAIAIREVQPFVEIDHRGGFAQTTGYIVELILAGEVRQPINRAVNGLRDVVARRASAIVLAQGELPWLGGRTCLHRSPFLSSDTICQSPF